MTPTAASPYAGPALGPGNAGGQQDRRPVPAPPGNGRSPTGGRIPRRWPARDGGSRTSVTASMWSISSACRKPSTRAVASVARSDKKPEPGEFEAPNMTATAPIRLTSFSHGAGCACKLGSADLSKVLAHLPRSARSDILVDAATRDDAAVVRIAPDRALIATVDFFTPDRRQRPRLGRHRRRERGERRLRHGRQAAVRAQPGGLAPRKNSFRAAGPGARRRGRDPGAGGLSCRRRTFDRRSRAQVRPRRHRRSASGSGAHQRRAATPATSSCSPSRSEPGSSPPRSSATRSARLDSPKPSGS